MDRKRFRSGTHFRFRMSTKESRDIFSDRFSDTLKAARQLIGGTNENVLSPLSTQNLPFHHRIATTKEPFP